MSSLAIKGGDCGLHKIILASKSPRRRELLTQMGLIFSVCAKEVDETILPGHIGDGVANLALKKGEAVADQVKDGLIIGADTVVILDGQILGKPESPAHAKEMLTAMSGKKHHVITGIAVMDVATGKMHTDWEQTTVYFRQLKEDTINAYIATGEPMDKAGAYGIQGQGGLLVTGIEGCYFNVVGLPITKLANILEIFDIKVL